MCSLAHDVTMTSIQSQCHLRITIIAPPNLEHCWGAGGIESSYRAVIRGGGCGLCETHSYSGLAVVGIKRIIETLLQRPPNKQSAQCPWYQHFKINGPKMLKAIYAVKWQQHKASHDRIYFVACFCHFVFKFEAYLVQFSTKLTRNDAPSL